MRTGGRWIPSLRAARIATASSGEPIQSDFRHCEGRVHRRTAVVANSVSSRPLAAPPEWRNFAGVFARLRPPLRPTPSDVETMRRAIAGRDRRVLLLGVTPELSVLGTELVAIDNSPRMIDRVWPGDSARCRAVLGDWTGLPFSDSTFDAVIGDGSLNSAGEGLERVLADVQRVLAPGGKATFRIFASPESPETLADIQRDADSGGAGNVHALKWRIAMSLAALAPGAVVPVAAILAEFNRMFPDRALLSSRTGWSEQEIATLDAYVGADHALAFPTATRMLEIAGPHLGSAEVAHGSGYPLADRCPTMVWTKQTNPRPA